MTENIEDITVRHDMQTVAFYNIENLFDLRDSKFTNDGDFLPESVKRWTPKRYKNKLRKLGFAISNIGLQETGKHPAIIGLAEVENARVLEDLLNSKHLEDLNYEYVHFDSLDERGIDVAMLYDTNVFEPSHTETFKVELMDLDGFPDYTRDILLVSGHLDGEKVHLIMNHWSSRREGLKETEFKRLAASEKVSEIISSITRDDKDAKILILGDFNDNPENESLKRLVEDHDLFNPFETLRSFTRGTVKHKRQWFVFDQILISTNFFKSSKSEFEFFKANILDVDFLKQFKGPFKGSPFRTYVGKKYKGGYSDHFPVYTILKK
ncbi:Endonuclease/Exonuclease/phosphatase family protein [Hyunsoonleella jejuensis]|uniref:Endonuclease/Exonuclease/phosphatase family protein n=1 Tax=Hyunsoonleella jejuensis TaxID=419940 RepID=A0A1H9BPL4_9FLAO|nr:endonuclease [Hyunsoonleella jejuensis]SEP90835.1 Endonuclease/Exonuclease/phosphatase family protein [Hyunsoonleella jejuensis]